MAESDCARYPRAETNAMGQVFTNFIHDFRFAFRQIRKQPGFAVIATIVLGLGIGGSTAVFSVLYQALLKPLPYPDAQRLLFVHNFFPQNQVSVGGVSAFDFAEIRRHTDVFAGAGIFYWNDLTLTGLDDARHINVVNASATLFDVLGANPQLGRTFSEAEDQYGAAGTTLLSDGLWRSAFGADPNVLGRIIYLNGAPFTVVGVMPRSFQFPSHETQLWIPVALKKSEFTIQGGRLEKWLHMVVRLSPGATPQRTKSALQAIGDELASAFPSFYPKSDGWHFTTRQLGEEQTEAIRRWLYLAFGAALSVLLIACINVSGLLLIRATARNSEVAVRMAIGATKYRIARQMLTETSVLVFSGCILGFLFAMWAVHLVNLYGPLAQPTPVQSWTLFFALALALMSTICAGLLPALLTAELPVEQALKGGARHTSTRGGGWRNGIVAAQIALAVALIFTATQLSRSFLNLTREPAGFEQLHIWTGAIDLPSRSYVADQSWNTRFFEPLLGELASIPGVEAASGANAIPFNPSGVWTEELQLPGWPKPNPPPEAQIGITFPGYFEAIGIPLLRGRTFTSRDRAGSPLVAVIDEELANRYFPGEEPVGKLIGSGGASTPARIIGVVGSVRNRDLGGPHEPEVYYPELQERTESTYLVLRTKGDVDPTVAVRRAIAKLDPGVALYDVRPMGERVAASLKLRRFVAFLLNGLAITGLVLAVVGLHASLAHLVELRRREIGIRLALGAMQSQVVRMILARGGIVVASGLVAGTLGAVIAGLAVRSQLFGVELTDAVTWMSVLGALLIAAIFSACFPAWRAARIEPAVALRHE
jgi:putative ABC transport system permease protein